MSEDLIDLLEVGYLDPFGSQRTLRSASAPDFMTKPGEQPANKSYPPTLLTFGITERHAWAKYTTRGQSEVGFGAPTLDNSAGQYSRLRNCTLDGQQIVRRRGPRYGNYPADYPPFFTGTMEGVFFPWKQVQFLIRDSLGLFFQKPIQAALYGGTNVLPAGVDGVATDLQGKYKPILLGSAANFSPPCVNTSKLIYQIHDRSGINVGAVTVTAVYDKGVALTQGTQYATVALLQAATTSASHWDWCDDPVYGTFIRLGSSPNAAVTCYASSAVNTVAGILSAIMTGPGGINAALISGGDVLANSVPATVGYWVDTTQQLCGDVCKLFTDTCNAYLVDSRDGTWRLGMLSVPTSIPNLRFAPWQVKDGARGVNIIQGNDLGNDAPQVSSNTPAISVPVWRVIVNYDFNQTVQTEADIAGSGLTRLGYTKQQYRQVSVEDDSVLALHPLAATLVITTLYRTQADALTEANRQLTLRKVAPVVMELPLSPSDALGLDLMSQTFGVDIDNWSDLVFWPIGFSDDPGDIKTPAITTVIGWGIPLAPPSQTTQPGDFIDPLWGMT